VLDAERRKHVSQRFAVEADPLLARAQRQQQRRLGHEGQADALARQQAPGPER
jgi:hypothetical protein